MRKTSLVLAVLLAVAGICVMLWPVVTGNRLQSSAATAVQEFLAERNEPEQQYPEPAKNPPSIWPPMALTMKSSVCWRYLLWS